MKPRSGAPRRDRDAVEILIVGLCVLRLCSGWHGDFEEWLAALILLACVSAAIRELQRLI